MDADCGVGESWSSFDTIGGFSSEVFDWFLALLAMDFTMQLDWGGRNDTRATLQMENP
jgi:hypothetical protein